MRSWNRNLAPGECVVEENGLRMAAIKRGEEALDGMEPRRRRPHLCALAPGEDAEAVVLDFIIQPGPAGGSLAGLGRHGAIVGPLLYCWQPPDGAEAAGSRRTCGRIVLTDEAFRVRGALSGRAIAETVLRWPLHQS